MSTTAQAAPQIRQIVDLNFQSITAFGTAGSTVTTTVWDTGDNTDGFFPEKVELNIVVPATPNLASAATINGALTFTVLADTAATPTLALPGMSYVLQGTAAGSGAAVNLNWRIPGATKRYLAVQCAAGANAGNNSAVSFTAQLTF